MTVARHFYALLAGIACGCGGAAAGVNAGVDGGADSAVRADGGRDAARDTNVVEASRFDAGLPQQDARATIDANPTDGGEAGHASSCPGGCPTGYACGTANGLPVCRAASGIPLFKHVFIIMEENTSLSTLESAINSNAAPNFATIQKTYASGTGYHGVTHPSLPNYIALASGSPQGIGCDCLAEPGQGSCGTFTCNLLVSSCTCTQAVMNLADQLEAAGQSWMAFAEGMGTPCNLVNDDSTNYVTRHVPFLYFDDVQTDTARCSSHVVDYTSFKIGTAPAFTYIAPNLIDDMHSPAPATEANITNGDTWIGPVVADITASAAYQDGGLLIIVWDEDDDSGGITGTDDPVPIFVLSPYAKSGGYMSAASMDHYSLLATIDDGFNMPRLANAGVPRANVADTLADYFPAE